MWAGFIWMATRPQMEKSQPGGSGKVGRDEAGNGGDKNPHRGAHHGTMPCKISQEEPCKNPRMMTPVTSLFPEQPPGFLPQPFNPTLQVFMVFVFFPQKKLLKPRYFDSFHIVLVVFIRRCFGRDPSQNLGKRTRLKSPTVGTAETRGPPSPSRPQSVLPPPPPPFYDLFLPPNDQLAEYFAELRGQEAGQTPFGHKEGKQREAKPQM